MLSKCIPVMLIAVSVAFASAAHGQQFPIPGKPIRIVVPFAPGGQTDVQARAIAQKLTISLGVPVFVENKPGAATLIGAREVQRAQPDGHTLLYTIVTHVQLPHLYKTPPYDPFKDFTAITTGSKAANVLTSHVSTPFNTVQELVAYAKANPGKLNYASYGVGTGSHLNGELFKRLAGIEMVHVPYKGSAEAAKDLLAGNVQLFFDGPLTAMANVQSGRVKLLAWGAIHAPLRYLTCPPCAKPGTRSARGAIFGSGDRPEWHPLQYKSFMSTLPVQLQIQVCTRS
jgi:tripartite-type tricarboxylate transporter receptor subunit TctC